MPLLPLLVSPAEFRDALGDERVRVFDATVFLRRALDGGPYTVESGRESYTRAHIPGAGFADIPCALSDPASPFAFTLPAAEHFAAAAGHLGIGDGTHVVAYAQDAPIWATRLWWLLRYFGHDEVSVLDGGLAAWRTAGGRVEPGEGGYPPASFTARPRPELLASLADVREITGNGSACLVNALSPEAFRGEGPSAYSRPGRIPGSVNVPWNGLVEHGDEPLPPARRTRRRPQQRRCPRGPAGHRLLRRRHLRDGRPLRARTDRLPRGPAVRRLADRVERQPRPAPHHRLTREIATLGPVTYFVTVSTHGGHRRTGHAAGTGRDGRPGETSGFSPTLRLICPADGHQDRATGHDPERGTTVPSNAPQHGRHVPQAPACHLTISIRRSVSLRDPRL